MSKVEVIISNGVQYHTPFQVNELEKLGVNYKYITGLTIKKLNHLTNNIDESKVISLSKYIMPYKILARLFPKKSWNIYYRMHEKFDVKSTKYINECKIFHAFNGFALESFKKINKMNNKPIKIVECGVHPRYYSNICNEEFEKYGVYRESLSKEYIEKSEKEFKQADYILTLTDICVKSFIENGYDREKIIAIPLGANIEKFKKTKEKKSKFTVCYVGRVSILKGVQYLLSACEMLDKLGYDFECNIIGAIDDEIAQKIVQKYKDVSWANFIGKIEYMQLRDYYSESHVTVLPSLIDSFAMVVYESMACETPVIITENVGAPIIDNKHGYIVPIRNDKAIYDKLVYLYNNREQAIEMGKLGEVYVKNKSYDIYGEKLKEFYDKIINQK
ncbi:glycosyltransferase family 4 protein [Clostridium sp.]|uniref:glycosyltransferase family 4 protein n=1 Tax=Clostridium sp. TaxID=1506 RepID=UPI0026248547|nr:glycosyltransferase family 4 protein [Clostridium sp.]